MKRIFIQDRDGASSHERPVADSVLKKLKC